MTAHIHLMPFGACVREQGGAEFRLWAPAAARVELECRTGAQSRRIPVAAQGQGWHEVCVPEASTGTLYRWHVDDGGAVPDPASRSNPSGVHGWSEVIDPLAYRWTVPWAGRPWHEVVVYELHVGSFTPEGTFSAAQGRLEQLARLGITAVQLMPIASFGGRFGWGYDGVLPFAPHFSYGSPDELKRFIEAAHALGLMVFLDVVYNHFGPDGNHLGRYAPAFFSERHHTGWGQAINYDGPGSEVVREFFIHNALYWLEEYQLDGLRLDAVHAILDNSQPDFLQALSARARQCITSRPIHLMLENEHNDPARLTLKAPAAPGLYEGQWNDDFHHLVHHLLTGEAQAYYAPYANEPLGQLARCLTGGLVWQGGRGPDDAPLPRTRTQAEVGLGAMVNCLQNHDQVGNRAFGERLTQLLPQDAPLQLATALLLLQPGTPLLFMGQEFGALTPFLFFCDWSGELKQAVTQGRRREFSQFKEFADPATQARIPDPCSEQTWQQSQLDWDAFAQAPAQQWWALHRRLLALRRERLAPLLPALSRPASAQAERLGPRALAVHWDFETGETLHAALNLSPQEVSFEPHIGLAQEPSWPPAQPWWSAGVASPSGLGPWAGRWWWTAAHA